MKDLKFMDSWEKTRKRGIILYVITRMLLILTASLIGKAIGEHVSNGTIFQTIYIKGLIFMCLIGILMGTYLWDYNETRYKKLIKNTNNKSQ